MTLSAITILHEPPRVEMNLPGAMTGLGEDPMIPLEELAGEIRKHTGAEVTVRSGFLRDAPPGMVLVDSSGYEVMMEEIPEAWRRAVAARTILLDTDRSSTLRWLERYRFAGAVGQHRWFEWRMERDQENGGGLHGLRSLAAAIGATCFESPVFASEHYCVLHSDRYKDLPSLIVGYLEALDASTAP